MTLTSWPSLAFTRSVSGNCSRKRRIAKLLRQALAFQTNKPKTSAATTRTETRREALWTTTRMNMETPRLARKSGMRTRGTAAGTGPKYRCRSASTAAERSFISRLPSPPRPPPPQPPPPQSDRRRPRASTAVNSDKRREEAKSEEAAKWSPFLFVSRFEILRKVTSHVKGHNFTLTLRLSLSLRNIQYLYELLWSRTIRTELKFI